MRIQSTLGVSELNNIQGVLFDLDGTLIDSLDLHIESFKWILKRLGKEVDVEELETLMGLTPQDIIKNFFADLPHERLWAAATEKEKYLETIIDDVYVYRGIPNFLQKLKENGLKTVVISSTHERLVKILLKKAGLLKFIDEIVSGDSIINGKPNPEPFIMGSRALKIKVLNLIGIGDSVYDGQSCTAAGIRFIGILTGKTDEDTFHENNINEVIENIDMIDII